MDAPTQTAPADGQYMVVSGCLREIDRHATPQNRLYADAKLCDPLGESVDYPYPVQIPPQAYTPCGHWLREGVPVHIVGRWDAREPDHPRLVACLVVAAGVRDVRDLDGAVPLLFAAAANYANRQGDATMHQVYLRFGGYEIERRSAAPAGTEPLRMPAGSELHAAAVQAWELLGLPALPAAKPPEEARDG